MRYQRLTVMRRLIEAFWRDRGQFSRKKVPRTCPMCDYTGIFVSVGRPSRWDARCAGCGSRERHRLMHLWATAGGADRFAGKRILHFAPEQAVIRQMRNNRFYDTADLHQADVTHRVDITATNLFSDTYDVVIAHHVLEHIEADRQAMAEIFRLLKPGGVAVLSVPINGTREATYENPAITAVAERFAHFGAEDHKRLYGLDFSQRLMDAGFSVETFRMPQHDEGRFGLLPDEWLYLAREPASPAS